MTILNSISLKNFPSKVSNTTKALLVLFNGLSLSVGTIFIGCAPMTIGRFYAEPCHGHLDHLQRICGYLQKYPDAAICFCTEILDYSELEHITFDWAYSVYGESKEDLPHDMPTPARGKPVYTTTFADAPNIERLVHSRKIRARRSLLGPESHSSANSKGDIGRPP
jgi:hypothetical protein